MFQDRIKKAGGTIGEKTRTLLRKSLSREKETVNEVQCIPNPKYENKAEEDAEEEGDEENGDKRKGGHDLNNEITEEERKNKEALELMAKAMTHVSFQIDEEKQQIDEEREKRKSKRESRRLSIRSVEEAINSTLREDQKPLSEQIIEEEFGRRRKNRRK